MGSVYQRKDGRWVAKYQDLEGSWRYLYRKSKGEAKQALREALKDRDDGIIPASKMTVGLYLDEWFEDRRNTISPRTWRNQESIIRCHVKPHIGTVRLSKLTGKDVTNLYRRNLTNGLRTSTVRQIHALLNQAMRDAVRSKYIRTNPLDGIKPPKDIRKEPDILTKEQVMHLLDCVRGARFECAFVLMALCGLRINECLSLEWRSVDLEAGTLTVRAGKTPSARRTLTLPVRALESLVRLRSTCDGTGYLFPTSSGNPVDVSNFYRWSWRPMLTKAGLPETLTPHKLRHGAASLLLNEGVPLTIVSRYLGSTLAIRERKG